MHNREFFPLSSLDEVDLYRNQVEPRLFPDAGPQPVDQISFKLPGHTSFSALRRGLGQNVNRGEWTYSQEWARIAGVEGVLVGRWPNQQV